ncbi:MAG: class I tRNA ligase family protein, partial [Candidatus Moranbacteria bacterium]|nr:class I tRNA ligase family protein [Candidatus Moranbacteria bacterium]
MEKYEPKNIEKKWQEKWESAGIYKNYSGQKKFYVLDMFPYPSGAGLHVGHPKGYIATDVISRFKMLNGFSVLHPMGWDAFGLPAENYAIKNKVHPSVATEKNVATFKKQLEAFGFTYDWDREINTTDPQYYKWTQWIFLKMFEKGLAYQSNEPVNWCPSCKTVLSNEDLEDGLCERCGTQVVQKKMRQWVLKMTDYAERLLTDLDSSQLDWEDSIKEQQKNWIGKSEGAIVKFSIFNSQFSSKSQNSNDQNFIEVFTTRVDTIFGCTYCVVAPEHPIIEKLKDKISNYKEVEEYLIASQNKTTLERTQLQKEKTGVKLEGVEVVNPFNDEAVPLFVADYVLGGYGSSAVMAVPAHDERDFEFAKKYDLPIKQSIAPLLTEKEGDYALRDGIEIIKRKTVIGIVKHWSEEKYYCLHWEKFGWKSFVIGGVKENEEWEAAVIREVKEETGYQDIKKITKVGGTIHDCFFAAHKGINRYADMECYLVELGSDKFVEPDYEEVKNHVGVWIPSEEIADYVNLSAHEIYWDVFCNDEKAFTEDGILVESDKFSGLKSPEAREKMTAWLEEKGIGKRKVNYKMRDWIFSRQRYWGEPIPIVHCEKCGAVGVPEEQLPVRLPEVENYEPTGTGESPLAAMDDWVNTTCPKCGGPAKRETNTMPQWAGSSWYYLRYIDPKNENRLVGEKEEKRWMPVDLYVGGAEHATRHLLYARFWHKFLFDIGVVTTSEPFKKLMHVGLILAEDGRKMSKRWNNVINPDEVIGHFGADSMRLYEMFMGPFSQSIAWSTNGVVGTRKFLEKVWKLSAQINTEEGRINTETQNNKKIQTLLHKTIKKVSGDIENFRFNTAISQLMILVNALEKEYAKTATTKAHMRKEDYEKLLLILSPFAPHIAEELWQRLGNEQSIFLQKWPVADEKYLKDEEIEMVIQVNGKIRERLMVATDVTEDEIK